MAISKEDEERFGVAHEAYEGALAASVEKELTERFGPPREVGPGIKWLTGSPSYRADALDHPQYRIKEGKKTITASPYQLDADALGYLLKLAEDRKLWLSIVAISNYNRGTMLIILSEFV